METYSELGRKAIGKCIKKCNDNISSDTFEKAFGQPYAKFADLTDEGDAEVSGKQTDEEEEGTQDPPLIEQIYEAIKEVIGGTNENQFFCMMSPGTTLNESDYRYDTRGLKPASVSANESRLVNKLFDACHVTGSDNGRSLPTQFLSALNVLTPKLNPEIAKAKNALRTMLMTKIKYDFEEGTVESTFQQVFYRLYEDWVKEKQKWAKVQDEKKNELELKYGGDSEEAKQEIEGVLNSSVGSELYEAKTAVLNAKRYNPDGGSVYPVTLTPSDWPKFLNSNFNAVDLLDTPDALLQEYRMLTNRRLSLTNQIARFQDLDQSSDIAEKIKELNEAKKAYDDKAAEVGVSRVCRWDACTGSNDNRLCIRQRRSGFICI